MISNDVTHNDISRLNSNKKNWLLMDYINYYTVKGVKEFKELSKLINEYPHLPVTFLISVIGGDGSKQRGGIQTGYLSIEGLQYAREFLDCLGDFKIHFEHADQCKFLNAILFMHNTGNYDHDKMIQKISSNPTALVPCANTKQYIRVLQEIFNKSVHEKNIVLFLKR